MRHFEIFLRKFKKIEKDIPCSACTTILILDIHVISQVYASIKFSEMICLSQTTSFNTEGLNGRDSASRIG